MRAALGSGSALFASSFDSLTDSSTGGGDLLLSMDIRAALGSGSASFSSSLSGGLSTGSSA